MLNQYQQIDVAKGVGIVSVLLLHSLNREALKDVYATYHIGQAVPLFMVIMGLTLGLSLRKRPVSFSGLYSRLYFQRRFDRLVFPLLQVYAASFIIGLAWLWVVGQNKIEFNLYSLLGFLPVSGPGNYFVTLVLQSIFLLPLIGYCFQRWPAITAVVLVMGEAGFLLIGNQISLFDENNFLYSSALPRYFSAIVLGLFLAKLVNKPLKFSTLVLFLLMGLASGAYLFLVDYQGFRVPLIREDWDAQNLMAFGFPALVLFVWLKLLPYHSEFKILKFPAALGKASYHIFLVQIVYFGLIPSKTPVLLNLACCLILGYLFYRHDNRLQGKLVAFRKKLNAENSNGSAYLKG